MKKFLLIAALLFAGFAASAQPYNWAVGVRGAYGWGTLSAKHYFSESNALDLAGSVSIGKGWGWELAALYEWTYPVITDGFDFYFGAGPHGGTFMDENVTVVALGVQGVVGLEYTFSAIPLNLFLDYRPALTLNIGNNSGLGFGYSNIGLGIRIAF